MKMSFLLLFFLFINLHALPKSSQTDADDNNSNYTVDSSNVNLNNNHVSNTGEDTSAGNQSSQSNSPTSFNPIRLNKIETNNPYYIRTQSSTVNNNRRNSNDDSSGRRYPVRQPPPSTNHGNQSNNNQETTHPTAERNLTDSVVTPGDKSSYNIHPRNDFPESEPQVEEKPQPIRPPHWNPTPHIPTGERNSSPSRTEPRKKTKTDQGPNYLSARRDEREDRKYTPLPNDDPRRPTSDDNNNTAASDAFRRSHRGLTSPSTQRNNPMTPQERNERQKNRYENNLKNYANNTNSKFNDLSAESKKSSWKNSNSSNSLSNNSSRTNPSKNIVNNRISL